MTRNTNTHADYQSCAARGMTVPEAAAHLGVSRSTVYVMASRYGITFAPNVSAVDRWRALADRWMTAAEAARELGLTVAAAYRMTEKYGIRFRQDEAGRPPVPSKPKPPIKATPKPPEPAPRAKVPLRVPKHVAAQILRDGVWRG